MTSKGLYYKTFYSGSQYYYIIPSSGFVFTTFHFLLNIQVGGVVPAKPFQHSVMLNCSLLGAFIGDDYEENGVLLNVTRVTNTSPIFIVFYFTP